MAANPHYAEGEVIANKYVVEGLAGESPSARTFLANSNAGKLCVKIYRADTSSKLLAAPDFFLKAGVMTEIAHDNLCACIDVQEEMGLVFVARAYAEGQTFEEWVRRHRGEAGHFTRGLELLWQACQGLTTLHERTRHNNIHPGNVIVGPVVAKLCDWDPRALGNTEMTPDPLPLRPEYQGYRAPEAAGRGGFLSYPSTDLFAIAGLLYRMVKGEHPSTNPAQTLGEARNMDRDLALFLGKALHPKPEERFQDASAFSDALWELGGAMQRLQEKFAKVSPPVRAPEPVPAPKPAPQSDPFDSGFGYSPPAKEPTLYGAQPSLGQAQPAAAKTEDDSFFNFFPSADPVPPQPAPPRTPAFVPPPPEPVRSGGDTLFGAPSFSPPPPIAPPRREPAPPPPPLRGGMSDLESGGTVFGAQSPLFAAPKAAPPRGEPPPQARPMAVSLSSLEKDPLEAASSGEPAGFTAYGFEGAGDNRTGIYNPDGKAAAAKAKLRLMLGAAGVLLLLLGLVGLFIFMRGNAADQAKPAIVADEEGFEPEPMQPTGSPEPAPAVDPVPAVAQPYPEVATPEPVAPETPPQPEVQAQPPQPYSEPPMPVEPPRPGATPETFASTSTSAAKAPKPVFKGSAHVTPEREAALVAMVNSRAWPTSATDRLKAADDLNDLGKTAEANLVYAKALSAPGIGEKQKISALGGLAVTFQTMGMKDQARDAVEKILAINPKNGFALKLKGKL